MLSLRRFHRTGLGFVLALGCAGSRQVATQNQTWSAPERHPSVAVAGPSAPVETSDAASGASTHDEATPVVEAARSVPARLPRMTSVGLFTYIQAVPSRGAWQLGYLHGGSSLPRRRA